MHWKLIPAPSSGFAGIKIKRNRWWEQTGKTSEDQGEEGEEEEEDLKEEEEKEEEEEEVQSEPPAFCQ